MQPRLRFKKFHDGWQQERLSQATKVTMGQSPLSKNYTNNPRDYLLIQGNADLANGRITPRLFTKQITKLSHQGDTILTVRAPVGAVAINNYGTAVIGRGVANLAKNTFIRFWLQHFQNAKGWLRYSTGSTFNSINSKIIKNLPLAYPNIQEQRLIGKFFAKLDKMISLQQAKCSLLKKQKRGYLQKLFPRKNESVPRVRFYGFNDKWKLVKLENIAKVTAGGDVNKEKLSDNGKYPVISNGLDNNGIEGYYQDYKIKAPAVTVTGRGKLGVAKVRYISFTPVVRLITVQSKKLDSVFCANAINQIHIFKEYTGVPQLTAKQLKRYSILIPSLKEQEKIGHFFRKLDNNIDFQNNKLHYLRRLKKAYLQKMFC